jgi:exodeoxyribonuclease V gamma subunit
MYHDYRSKSLPQLTHKFLDVLSENSSDDPFQKNWIIVQNREMQQWLSLSLARKYKIAANNEFIFPSELIWKLYRVKNPKLDTNLPSDIIPLQWSIFELLQNDLQLQNTLFRNRAVDQKLLLQVSHSIADVFDLYQVFRPDMLKKWNSGGYVYKDSQEVWQADLWNKLCNQWKSNKTVSTRVEVFNKLKDWLSSGSFPLKNIPNCLMMFCIPQIPNPVSEIYTLLSRDIQCHQFTVDVPVQSQHPDLKTFNAKILNSVQNRNEAIQRILNKHTPGVKNVVLDTMEPSFDLRLHQIQRMLLGETFESLDNDDHSVSINSCHSKKREVEVLKDSILEAMNSNPELKAEDILVLVPDINDYRSHLNESFVSDTKDLTIPINLGFSDHTEFRESTFLTLIGLLNSDFKVNSIIDLLDNPIISEKWKFTDNDIKQIREWASELHIHRFIDGDVFSWTNGLNRLFLGFAMEKKEHQLVNDTIPYDKLYSTEAVELVGKLSAFIDEIETLSKLTSSLYSVPDWLSKAKSIVQVFLLTSFNDQYKVQSLVEKIETLKKQVHVSKVKEKIEFDTFFLWLKDQFSSNKSSSTGFGHGITVNEYVPNRSIPYKFVGILGFNESKFPRTQIRPDFDLIQKYPQPGDRISIDEDRYLFFDMIQSAEERLHISYIGQDQYSENKKAPSILLQELMDITKDLEIDLNIIEHKLHGFDPAYFRKDGLKSFSKNRLEMVENLAINRSASSFWEQNLNFESEYDTSSISLYDLISFYTHPIKFVCNSIFGIRDNEDFKDLDDREPFKLDGLGSYFLKDHLVYSYLKKIDDNVVRELAKADGLVPQGYPGLLELNAYKAVLDEFNEVRDRYDFSLYEMMNVDFEQGQSTIHGSVQYLIKDERVIIKPGNLKSKYLMELWLTHQLLSTTNTYKSSLYYIDKKKGVESVTLESSRSDIQHFIFLIDRFKECISFKKNNLFPMESSFAFAKSMISDGDVENAIKEAQKAWDGGEYGSSETDFYNLLIYKNDDFINTKEFQENALAVWSPILKAFGDQ